MKDPLKLEIPARMTIELDKAMREALRRAADVFVHESDEELAAMALRRGLIAMLRDVRHQPSPAEIAENINAARARMRELQFERGTELASKATVVSRRHPGRRYQEKVRPYMEAMKAIEGRHELGLSEADCNQIIADFSKGTKDVGQADSRQDDAGADPGVVPHRHVERYVAAPISEDLRQRLEDFLGEHPELERERCIAALLGLGLDKAEMISTEKGSGLKEKTADQMLRLAERLCARAKRRCVW